MKRHILLAFLLSLLLVSCAAPSGEPFTSHEANDEDPSLIKVGDTYYAAWFSERSGNSDIWLRTGDGVNWDEPRPIIESSRPEFYPTLAYDGQFHLSFFRIGDSEGGRSANVWYAVSEDGVSWAEEQITFSRSSDWVPRIMTYDGKIYLVWSSNQGGNKELYLVVHDGQWSEPIQITNDPLHDDFPSIAIIDGIFYLAWSRFDLDGGIYGGPSSKIMLASSTDGMDWSEAKVVSDESKVKTDVFPIIYEKNGEGNIMWTSSFKDPYGDIVSRSLDDPTYEYLATNPFPDYSATLAGDILMWVTDPKKDGKHEIYFKRVE